jgi:hypothetical protein
MSVLFAETPSVSAVKEKRVEINIPEETLE